MSEREPTGPSSAGRTVGRWRSSPLAWVGVLVGIGLLVVAAGFWQTRVTVPGGNWCGSVRTPAAVLLGGVRDDGLGPQVDPGCAAALDGRRAWVMVALAFAVAALGLALVAAIGLPRRAAPLPEGWPSRNDSDVLRR